MIRADGDIHRVHGRGEQRTVVPTESDVTWGQRWARFTPVVALAALAAVAFLLPRAFLPRAVSLTRVILIAWGVA